MTDFPNKQEFRKAVAVFQRNEKRDAIYNIASYLVKRFWNETEQLTAGLGVLLLIWNHAFYRFGSFDFDKLAACIDQHRQVLTALRRKRRPPLNPDRELIAMLFRDFRKALRSESEKKGTRYSPVATAKALHLLAPRYFPLWDKKIAQKCGCDYNGTDGVDAYLSFIKYTNDFFTHVGNNDYVAEGDNPLKKIDEYNYVTYTKPDWLKQKSSA